jgi:DNA-binding transcriptional MerR regulator
MEYSIQQLAKVAGTTSRTLRHYDNVGLLHPSRVGAKGYRYYDGPALLRLQRILLLRGMGLGLPAIADVLARPAGPAGAAASLEHRAAWLRAAQERLSRQIRAVERTIRAIQQGEEIMAEKMFDGFDHTQYRREVERRWGADASAAGDAWWNGMDGDARQDWQERSAQLARDWAQAAADGEAASGRRAQELARRHVAWLTAIPGTPAARNEGDVAAYVLGLGRLYVEDPRFAANYGGTEAAAFVRDALAVHVRENM